MLLSLTYTAAFKDNLEDELPPPVTPQHHKYYRDYDTIEHPSRLKRVCSNSNF